MYMLKLVHIKVWIYYMSIRGLSVHIRGEEICVNAILCIAMYCLTVCQLAEASELCDTPSIYNIIVGEWVVWCCTYPQDHVI